jgi:hypothetical protein
MIAPAMKSLSMRWSGSRFNPDSPDEMAFGQLRAPNSTVKSISYAGSSSRILTDLTGERRNRQFCQRSRGLRSYRPNPSGESGFKSIFAAHRTFENCRIARTGSAVCGDSSPSVGATLQSVQRRFRSFTASLSNRRSRFSLLWDINNYKSNYNSLISMTILKVRLNQMIALSVSGLVA